MSRKKVGLALGAGGARGLAHIGVLEVLQREGIPIDMIAGTSIGALVGAIYAQKQDVALLKDLAVELGAKRLSYLADPALPKTGLIRARRIEETLRSILGDAGFDDLPLPFACVAVDIDSGEEVVIRRGKVWEAIRASITVPVIFSLPKWEGRYLADGGLVNPVPVSVVKDMGADFVIAVNVSAHRSATETQEPNIFGLIVKVLYIYGHRLVESSLQGADVVIAPPLTHIAVADFHHAAECIRQGELAAEASMADIASQLGRSQADDR